MFILKYVRFLDTFFYSEQINSLVSTNSPFIRSNQEHLRRQQPAVDDAVGSPVHVNNTSNMNIQESVAIARKVHDNIDLLFFINTFYQLMNYSTTN